MTSKVDYMDSWQERAYFSMSHVLGIIGIGVLAVGLFPIWFIRGTQLLLSCRCNPRATIVTILRVLHVYRPIVAFLKWRQATKSRNQTARFYSQFVRRGDLCFDVGANVGTRTEVFRHLGASVIAVEPLPNCVSALTARWQRDSKVTVIPMAVGAEKGHASVAICPEYDAMSSCSPDWLATLKGQDRFKEFHWDETIDVPMTTLDSLIARFGVPAFIKIDVETFEAEVIKGLSHPIKALSLEYQPKFLTPIIHAIERLATLASYRFNYSKGETFAMALSEWVTADPIYNILRNLPDKEVSGDVYAKLA